MRALGPVTSSVSPARSRVTSYLFRPRTVLGWAKLSSKNEKLAQISLATTVYDSLTTEALRERRQIKHRMTARTSRRHGSLLLDKERTARTLTTAANRALLRNQSTTADYTAQIQRKCVTSHTYWVMRVSALTAWSNCWPYTHTTTAARPS
jgi:hypothetical protein